MRIAVDCRMIEDSGIGNFLKNILINWVDNVNFEFLLIGDESVINKYLPNTCKILNCNLPIFSVKEFLFFPTNEINRCDVFFTPNYNLPLGINIPIISTIHDVVFLDNPYLVSKIGLMLRYIYLKRAYIKSRGIVTVSNFSKKRIQHYFGRKKEIKVIYNGITKSLENFKNKNTHKKIYDFPYIVYVGNIKRHKNLSVLIDAYKKLRKENFVPKLVIVGEINNFRTGYSQLTEEIIPNNDIYFTGKINDDDLFITIQNANALIQPSLYEGFGMPPLEALYLNTLPIISDIPVFKEIYKNTPAIFFKTNDSADLCRLIKQHAALKNNVECNKLISNVFNYKNSSEILIQFINQLKNCKYYKP